MAKAQKQNNSVHKARALRLLRRGFVTLSEAADLSDTSRQLVRFWARQNGIDYHKARADYLARVWGPVAE